MSQKTSNFPFRESPRFKGWYKNNMRPQMVSLSGMVPTDAELEALFPLSGEEKNERMRHLKNR